MNRADRTLTIALCASLLIHGGMLAWLVRGYINELLAALPQPALALPEPEEDLIYIDRADANQRRMLALGDSSGIGSAVNASPGQRPMLAVEGPSDQAWLSRDPRGFGAADGSPAESVLPEGGGGRPAPAAVLAVDGNAVKPFGVASSGASLVAPRRTIPLPASAIAVGPADTSEPPTPTAPEAIPAPARPQADAKAIVVASAAGSAPGVLGAAAESADPAPQGEMDSDPFSRIGSAEFRSGKVDVKLGRKFKVTRPKLLLAGRDALLALRFPSLMLKIHIDETGAVTDVEVSRSSGSNEIDQPCQLAAYDWWFEPTKDAEGNAVPDVILFTIQWR